MDAHLLKEKMSAYRNLIRNEDALPLYDSMESTDLAHIVAKAQSVLILTARMPVVPKLQKCEMRSEKYRVEGDELIEQCQYQRALTLYNKALCHAPNESHSLKLAYANRSALFQKLRAYEACIVDADICLRLGCPPQLEDQLRMRHRGSRELGWIDKMSEENIPDFQSLGKFFKLQTHNPQINSATLDVGVTKSGNKMKVVAAKSINVGAVIAFESAFVSQTNDVNKYLACSFCHKMALNLVPCRYCCDALFCGPICMNIAMAEYHGVECHLSEVLRNTSTECRMALKSVVRMKNSCTSWDMFMEHTKLFGEERVANSTVAEVFGNTYPYSILCMDTDKLFVQGTLYKAAVDCAVVLFYLDKLPFLPRGIRRREAIATISRMMMYLCVYHSYTQMQVVTGDKGSDFRKRLDENNYGWFPLISKLKNSCVPNVIALAVNKEMALVAIQPIKRGTEITIAYLGHWLDVQLQPRTRQKAMLALSGALCSCRLCLAMHPLFMYAMTEKQAKVWRRLKINELQSVTSTTVDDLYLRLSRSLGAFKDVPFSNEYRAIYEDFRRCLMYYQTAGFPQRLVQDYHAS